MKNLFETVRAMYAPQTEATMMKDDGKVVHNCAQHVEHASWGQGRCITEEHADPDRYGNIAWYDIEFPHGIEKGVPVSELKILQAESHGHATKKSKKMAAEAVDLTDGKDTNMDDADDKVKGKKSKKSAETQVEEGMTDTLKSGAKKFLAKVGGGSDEDQLKRLQKNMGVPQTGKKPVKEEVEEAVDETVIHADREYALDEAQKTGNYDAHFKAQMAKHGIKHPGELDTDEKKKAFFNKVDAGYKAKNESVFVEAYMSSDIQDVITAHKKAGNRISDEKSGSRDGKPHHSFVVTTPEGKRTRHIYHGTTKKLESMSPAKKSRESSEQDLDDK